MQNDFQRRYARILGRIRNLIEYLPNKIEMEHKINDYLNKFDQDMKRLNMFVDLHYCESTEGPECKTIFEHLFFKVERDEIFGARISSSSIFMNEVFLEKYMKLRERMLANPKELNESAMEILNKMKEARRQAEGINRP